MSEIKKLTIGQDELDLSKYSYATKIDNNSGNSIYKKITITTEANKASDGCLIFGRNQFYLLNLMYASGYMGALHEIGTKANNLAANVGARYIHLKVRGTADKRETIIYACMDAYNFISMYSTAEVVVENSTKEEFDSASTNVTYRYIPNENEIKVKYTDTNLKPADDTTASWRTLFNNTPGVYFTNYSESNCFTNQPNRYGFLRTIIQSNEVNQMFTTQPDGIIYSRAGNRTGWNNSATDTGAFTKITPNDGVLTIQKNGTNIDTFSANSSSNKTVNITVPVTAADVSALPDSTKYGSSFELSVNSSTFVVTASLKDQDGNVLGTTQTIDLPLESVVVSGSFDSSTKKIILTLQNGNTVEIPVGDLVAGLQTEITSTNKLSSDLVDDTNHTNKFMTSAEKTKLSGIAAGAEVNQNAFSNVKVGSTTISADSKTDTVELVAGNYIDIAADATNDKVTISSLNDPPRTVLYLSNGIGYENPFKIYKWSEETGLVEITHSELSQLFRASSGNDVIFHYAGSSDHVYTVLEFGNETSEFTVMDSWGNDVKIYSIASSSSSDTDFEIYDEWTIQEKLTQGSQISISNGIISVAPNVITSIDWTSLWQ